MRSKLPALSESAIRVGEKSRFERAAICWSGRLVGDFESIGFLDREIHQVRRATLLREFMNNVDVNVCRSVSAE
jgi:hypothetical protein